MTVKPSEEPKTCIVKAKQKNGDTYVYERQILYNAATKNNRILKSTLIGKIPSGSTEIVETRPKRPPREKVPSGGVQAKRQRAGMMDIIAHAGKASGIDDILYQSTDRGTAQKIISLARYLVATDGRPLPGIVAFQYMHPLPYEDGISEGIYHALFEYIGLNPSIEQSFFHGRCRELGSNPSIAYDSTSITTYSDGQIEARRGMNKNRENLPEIKFLVLYAMKTHQPIAFRKLPGNISDVSTIREALKQLDVLGIRGAELITDNGYYGQSNIADMYLSGFRFVTLVKTSLRFVAKAIEDHREELLSVGTALPYDPGVHGSCVAGMQTFERPRCYAGSAKGLKKGDVEDIRRRVYLQIYFDAARKAEEDRTLDEKILAAKELLETGTSFCDLGDPLKKIAAKYLTIRTIRGDQKVSVNEEACEKKRKHHGFFALISNKRKDPSECLKLYRKRNRIELDFEFYKDKTDGGRPRVWSADVLQGRMFVQFVALCYREYLEREVHSIMSSLKQPDEEDRADVRNLKEKLRAWLENTSLHDILQWFDTMECTDVSIKLRKKRLRTEITARDRLFLKMLGIG